MKDIKSIEFVFENCEVFSIDACFFSDFSIENTEVRVNRIACNSISRYTVANTIAFCLFKEANRTYHIFDIEDEKTTYFDRLKVGDITCINLTYEDDETESFYIDYKEENDALGAPNLNQKVYESDLGDLYIVISEKNNIEDVFDMNEINDKEFVDFEKSMILENAEDWYRKI